MFEEWIGRDRTPVGLWRGAHHPPDGRPGRSRRLISSAVLGAVVLATGACGARSLEAADTGSKISAKIAQQQPDLRGLTVTCPADLKAEKGASFVCSVRADGGFAGEVLVDQTDDAGSLAIRYPAPPGTGPRATVIVVPTTGPQWSAPADPGECGDATTTVADPC